MTACSTAPPPSSLFSTAVYSPISGPGWFTSDSTLSTTAYLPACSVQVCTYIHTLVSLLDQQGSAARTPTQTSRRGQFPQVSIPLGFIMGKGLPSLVSLGHSYSDNTYIVHTPYIRRKCFFSACDAGNNPLFTSEFRHFLQMLMRCGTMPLPDPTR
jgi:hypothetical protein